MLREATRRLRCTASFGRAVLLIIVATVVAVLLTVAPDAALASPTAAQIDDLLSRYSSPMTGTGAVFVREGEEHGVDPAFLVAITGAETSFGRYLYSQGGDVCTFNAFNWFYGPTWPQSDFASWEEGIARVAEGISGSLYYGSGLTSVDAISFRYCPVGTAEWLANVRAFMLTLGGDPADTRLGYSPAAPSRALPGVSLVGGVRARPAKPLLGDLVEIRFVLTNPGETPVDLEVVRLAVRGPRGASADMVSREGFTLRAGESRAVTAAVAATLAGRWHGWIEVQRGGKAARVGAARALSYRVAEPPQLAPVGGQSGEPAATR